MKIADVLEPYEDYLRYEKQLSASTIVAYRSDLLDLARHLHKDLQDCTPDDLRSYMRMLGKRGLKVSSIRRRFHGFGTFWRWLRIQHLVGDVITEFLTLPRAEMHIPRWLSETDLRRFVEMIPLPYPARDNQRADWTPQRDLLAWRLLAWLGLRRSEILNLKIEDVLLSDEMIIIRQSKGRKDRILPLPATLKDEFKEVIGDRRSGFVFQGRNGGQWKVKAFYRAFQWQLRACGLDGRGITPHTLRHTFATHLLHNDVALPDIQQLLGHADIKSTLIYAHVDYPRLQKALSKHTLNRIKDSKEDDQ